MSHKIAFMEGSQIQIGDLESLVIYLFNNPISRITLRSLSSTLLKTFSMRLRWSLTWYILIRNYGCLPCTPHCCCHGIFTPIKMNGKSLRQWLWLTFNQLVGSDDLSEARNLLHHGTYSSYLFMHCHSPSYKVLNLHLCCSLHINFW